MTPTITINGQAQDFSAKTLAEYLAAMNITPDSLGIAVAVNNVVILRSEWHKFTPQANDRIEIITAIGGG